jgi:hypothetical protein
MAARSIESNQSTRVAASALTTFCLGRSSCQKITADVEVMSPTQTNVA